jgi:hypothetical protein
MLTWCLLVKGLVDGSSKQFLRLPEILSTTHGSTSRHR